MEEIWKDIKGYEGIYQVSNLGRIRSLDRLLIYKDGSKHFWYGQIIKLELSCNYLYVHLSYKKKTKSFRVHRIVAEAFIPNPNNLPQVNHKNEDKTDNNVENLEWVSARDNINYGTAPQRRAKTRYKSVIQYDLNNNIVAIWPSIKDASRKLCRNHTAISNCLRGIVKTAYGFKWKYKDERAA